MLQALATQVVLEHMGFQVTVVDYYPPRNSIPEMLRGLKNKKPILENNPVVLFAARAVLLPSYIKRRHIFDAFIERNLNLSERTYWSNDELANQSFMADIYVTGSDQVWNSDWNGGIDEALFLAFTTENDRRIAFSASFGKDCLTDAERFRTKKLLERYDAITVREDTGVEIVRSLGMRATQILDPTLMLSPSDWRPWISNNHPNGEYILMYNINHNAPLDRFVNTLAERTKLPIYYISYQLHDCLKHGHMRCCAPVSDFLSLIANARYVACDSFHCAAFSVNFNKDFAIVLPERFGTRLESFMRVVGLEDRIVNADGIDVFDTPIDWVAVNSRLEEERIRSLVALEEAIGTASNR